MPDRQVKVTVRAEVSNYLANMDAASRATKRATDTLAQQKAASIAAAKAQGEAAASIGRSMLIIGAAAAAGVGLAVAKFADFDKAMSSVQAATHESSSNMGLLRDAAIQAGADTVFSATEAANAVEELAKAGLSTSDILGGALTGSLSLASAGELGVAEAAGIMSTALTQFKEPGSAASHVADLLAAGAGKAMGSVQDLAAALNQGGLVASQAGMSIEDTTGTLAAFASAGLLGSDAGTSLKTMLLSLEKPSNLAQQALDEYGISVYDANGNMFSMSEMAGQLQEKLGGVSAAERNAALATIFGTDAVRSASVLYSEGADGIQGWIDKTNDAGYAAETARLKLDNLSGDMEQLGGSIDTALIKTGSGANEVLRGLTQSATGLVNGIGELPAPVLAAGLALGGVVAVAGLLGGGFLTLVPKIAAAKLAMTQLGITAKVVGASLGVAGVVLGAITAVTGAVTEMGLEVDLTKQQLAELNVVTKAGDWGRLNKDFVSAQGGVASFKDSLNQLFTSNFWTSYNGGPAQINGATKALTFGLVDLGKGIDENRAKFKELGKQLGELAAGDLPAATDRFNEFVKLAGGGKEAVRQLLEAFPDYKDQLIQLAEAHGETLTEQELFNLAQGKGKLATELAKKATEDNSAALAEMAGKARDANGDIGGLADTINNFGKAQLDVNSAQRTFQAAIDDLTQSVKDNGTSLDIGTEKGRANQAALDDIAKSSLGAASAILTQTGNQEDATKAVADGRAALIDALGQFHITGKAAEDYAGKLGLIPADITTAAYMNTDPATRELDAWLKANANHRVHVQAMVDGRPSGSGLTFADGGPIPGTPSHTDNMLIGAASGEYMVRTRQAQIPANRRALDYMNAGGTIYGYASGGEVGFTPAPVYSPAPPRMYVPGPGAGSVTRQGDTFNIYEAEHPVAVAQAIQRRQNSLAAV